MNENKENQAQEKSCYNCAHCEAFRDGLFGYGPSHGLMCQNPGDMFYPDGIPEAKICDRHSFKRKMSIEEAYPEKVGDFVAYYKTKGMSDEFIEMFLKSDAGILGQMGES